MINRRKFVEGIFGGLVIAASGNVLAQQNSHTNPDEIAKILRGDDERMNLIVKQPIDSKKSNRTILYLGTLRNTFVDFYVDFFNNMKEKIGLNKIFMELFTPENEPTTDSERYKKGLENLNERFKVVGLEDYNLYKDFEIFYELSFLIPRMYIYDSSKSPAELEKNMGIGEKIQDLTKKLKTVDFPMGDFPKKVRLEKDGPKKEREWHMLQYSIKDFLKSYVDKRNNFFGEVIDVHLKPNEVAGMIVQNQNKGVIDILSKKNIGVVYIPYYNVEMYLERLKNRN